MVSVRNVHKINLDFRYEFRPYTCLVAVMKALMEGGELLLIDSTHIKTLSSKNVWAQLGYNSQQDFEPQVNLLFLFAHDQQMPIFYRCVADNVREIRAMELALK